MLFIRLLEVPTATLDVSPVVVISPSSPKDITLPVAANTALAALF